ncbi:MAG: helix-turn-helix transcriptional regulator [Clostridiales bacterium]|nr:helix-turn-helix transcriptional regulator [Clostridiales bacterium]
MKTWDEYKKQIKESDPEAAHDLEEAEALADIIGAVIRERNDLGLSQRELAALCSLPQSSIARFESGKVSPNLTTLIRILRPLGLKLTVRGI